MVIVTLDGGQILDGGQQPPRQGLAGLGRPAQGAEVNARPRGPGAGRGLEKSLGFVTFLVDFNDLKL